LARLSSIVKTQGMIYDKGNVLLIGLRDSRKFSEKIVAEVPLDPVAGGDTIEINILGGFWKSDGGKSREAINFSIGSEEQNIAKLVSNIITQDQLA